MPTLSKTKRPRVSRPSLAQAPPRKSDNDLILEGFLPKNLTWSRLDWVVLVWMGAMHVGALAAPFFFTWQALAVTAVLHWVTCCLGVTLCYHRYLAHRSFKLARPVEGVVLFCGAISGEGTPLTWAATHRVHHARSDKEGDPHSPLEGAWWSHLLWMFIRRPRAQQQRLFRRYVPDLAKDPLIQFFEWAGGPILILMAVGLFALGGWPMLLWGMCVRMVLAYHSTWFVNSATHLWGYRNYETRDESRNLWWVALLSYGEGWHNNHHAYPRSARAGHKWWEVDVTWWVIRSLQACGLATEVQHEIPREPVNHADTLQMADVVDTVERNPAAPVALDEPSDADLLVDEEDLVAAGADVR